jgi:lipoprotein NlpI
MDGSMISIPTIDQEMWFTRVAHLLGFHALEEDHRIYTSAYYERGYTSASASDQLRQYLGINQ